MSAHPGRANSVAIPARISRPRRRATLSIRWVAVADTAAVAADIEAAKHTEPGGAHALPGSFWVALLDFNQPDLVGQAVGDDGIAVGRDIHIADDIAAAGDRPALEFLRRRVEAHDRVRLRRGFRV